MLTLVLALTVAAAPPPAQPKAGHYYRQAFAEQVARGEFDPDRYVTHREPSLRWTPPRATVDFGQERQTSRLRRVRTGTTARWERQRDQGWEPVELRVVDDRTLETDLAGQLERWVRLPSAFEELARKTHERRTAAKRASILGRYVADDGARVELGAKTGFKLLRCLESCQPAGRAWCVVHKRVTYRVSEDALVEVDGPAGLCPDGAAFEPKPDGRRYSRVR